MKKTQMIIAVPPSLLLIISLITSYKAGLFIAMAGLFVALLLRQIRRWKYGAILDHPSRRYDGEVEEEIDDGNSEE
ncbi:hypothetical protein [Bacillus sp. RAR_GA_16]|uniref:hypothetical protein n=1 Tax=Bacillus sp. RAR_GA_16 TaxID=2876774 RepID=UPI001CCC4B71|nr:hypothetical protein [Bacillus sp. RAR_GA_16]MCA0173951.1 hypothetical protein [Bacillus sp. RAR_GA_16]